MNESKYQLGETIPGTVGKVVSVIYSSDNRWVYTIRFNGGFLTIGEDKIDESIINVLKGEKSNSDG